MNTNMNVETADGETIYEDASSVVKLEFYNKEQDLDENSKVTKGKSNTSLIQIGIGAPSSKLLPNTEHFLVNDEDRITATKKEPSIYVPKAKISTNSDFAGSNNLTVNAGHQPSHVTFSDNNTLITNSSKNEDLKRKIEELQKKREGDLILANNGINPNIIETNRTNGSNVERYVKNFVQGIINKAKEAHIKAQQEVNIKLENSKNRYDQKRQRLTAAFN